MDSAAISTILGSDPTAGEAGAPVWMLDSPNKENQIKLELVVANNEDEKKWLLDAGGVGVYSVTIVWTTSNKAVNI